MTTPTISPALAQANSQAARAQFLATLAEAKDRLNPGTLAHNAAENVKDTLVRGTIDTARTHPVTVAAVAGAALLFFARKPLARLIRPDTPDATATAPASLNSQRSSRETEGSTHD